MKIIFYLPIKLLIPTRVIGKENRVKKGKVIVICNHQSLFDCLILIMNYGRKLIFLSKKEMFRNCIVAWILRKMGVISIDRNNVSVSSIKEIIKSLGNGNAICIFPEGTRNRAGNGGLLPFKDGVSLFAIKTNSPILPIYIKGKPRLFHKITMIIGKNYFLQKDSDLPNGKSNMEIVRNSILELANNEFQKK